MNKETFFENMKSYKFVANKSLGQNFLYNPSVAEDIVSTLKLSSKDKVIEIGCGLGSLSYFLTKSDAQITLIDVDENMINSVKSSFSNCKNVQISRQNILKTDLNEYTKIIGNLPYYITSGIIEHILLNAINSKIITLMVQKEVYQKLTNKKEISPLTLLLNYVASISAGTTINRNNFVPVPHVDSSYFSLFPNKNIKNENNKIVYYVMCQMFLYRRKTILNNLTILLKSKEKASKILDEMGISYSLRPEQLDINFYIQLSNNLKSFDFISKII